VSHFLATRQKHSSASLQRAIEAAERSRNEDELLRLLQEKQRQAVRRERQKIQK
jgi:predicted N-acyltransferase